MKTDGPLTELAAVLARDYFRLLQARAGKPSNLACSPSVAADPKRQNPLDVAAQQSDELDGHAPQMRSRCKQT